MTTFASPHPDHAATRAAVAPMPAAAADGGPQLLRRCQQALDAGWTARFGPEGLLAEVVAEAPDDAAGPALRANSTWRGGELHTLTDADGTLWAYRYGDDGRLLQVQRNGADWARWQHDAAGRLVQVEGPDGRTEHAWDAEGRLVRTRLAAGAVRGWRWQGQGPRSLVAEAFGPSECSRFSHDGSGRLVGVQQVVDGLPLTLRLSFDAQGRLAGWQVLEWGLAARFDWDARGRPQALHLAGVALAALGTDDAAHTSWQQGLGGVRLQAGHDAASGQCGWRELHDGQGQPAWQQTLQRDAHWRLAREGDRHHRYDALGRLVASADRAEGEALPLRQWHYRHAADGRVAEAGDGPLRLQADGQGRLVGWTGGGAQGRSERVIRYGEEGDAESVLDDGRCVARCRYDHKGRLVWLEQPDADGAPQVSRYLYGADDALLAVADAQGRPRLVLLRLPTGLVGAAVVDRPGAAPRLLSLFTDAHGSVVAASDAAGTLHRAAAFCPWGRPLAGAGAGAGIPGLPPIWRGRLLLQGPGLYRLGGRWYCPQARRFLTPDSHTGAPDDARLVGPLVPAGQQRRLRTAVLSGWLRQPLQRQRWAYCLGDPVNRCDPDGHWSFGGVMLSLLGVLWTLPNTAFGLAIEITCLIGEVVRWIVYACTLGHVSWQTPGFDVAASGRLNAFALVFKGGWLGSFESLLGITFGNVFFVNGQYEQHRDFQALPDPVLPPAYGGAESIPKAQALYEHELTHVQQYGRFGPFFHLGLPIFGVYEWDVILNGYQNAALEQQAREHAGF